MSNPPTLRFSQTTISGVQKISSTPFIDERGSFARLFSSEIYVEAGWKWPLSQIDLSKTKSAGTVRGIHFQNPPFAEAKIVFCLSGKVLDIAVDLRAESPTFLEWHGEILSAEDGAGLLIPRGCGHGFQALTDDCELLYAHSGPFHPTADAGFSPTDPRLGIHWPLPISILSARDASLPNIDPDFEGLKP